VTRNGIISAISLLVSSATMTLAINWLAESVESRGRFEFIIGVCVGGALGMMIANITNELKAR
jgi:hypothetical protein